MSDAEGDTKPLRAGETRMGADPVSTTAAAAPRRPGAAPPSDDPERLRWQCRRGMLELDLLLNRFLDTGFHHLDAAGREAFVRLLSYQDQILQDWLIGHAVPADPPLVRLVEQIRAAMRP